jgi:molybdenum cofactor guanylyltransferase
MIGSNSQGTGHSPVLILAGGRGRRLGGCDKAALPSPAMLGRNLLEVAIERYATLGPVWIACGTQPRSDLPSGLLQLLDPPSPAAADAGAGPLAGLYAGFEHAQLAGHGLLLSAPVDLTGVRAAVLAAMAAHLDDQPALQVVVARRQRDEPLLAAWRVDAALLESCRLALASGDGAVHRWQWKLRRTSLAVADDEPVWVNINTIEDLQQACRLYPLT